MIGAVMPSAGSRDPRFALLVAASIAVVLAVLGGLLGSVGRPYPGFFFSADYRALPLEPEARAAGLAWGDRIVAADGRAPLDLLERVRASEAPVRYEIERAGQRHVLTLAPRPFTWAIVGRYFAGYFVVSALMLAGGILVYLQNPAARPNRYFLVYMCLWAVGNVGVPDVALSPAKYGAALVGFVPTVLAVHGWIFFLTYPVNPARQAWLERTGATRILYAAALAVGGAITLAFALVYAVAPAWLLGGWLFPVTVAFQFALAAVSFPIKVGALVDTRRRAGSPLVSQQVTVLLLGIGLGLGLWLTLMLAPLLALYPPPLDPQVGAALVLLYPLAIGYATVRYRLFDATVVIRRSVAYTALAGVIAAAYALALAGANVVLARADLARSPWFAGAFMFVVALAVYPLRERMQRTVDRLFFRERYDYARAIQGLARSMTSLLDLDEIDRRLRTTIESTMHARRVRLVTGPVPPPIAPVLAAAGGALTRYQVAADPRLATVAPGALAAYQELQAEVVVPLRFQDALHGLLVLGPKRSEAPYTAEDLALLETVADQTAVAVANAEAHRRVVEYAQQLERSLLIRTNLAKFVPQRVRQLIEASPEAPLLEKRETDVSVLFCDISGYTRLSSRLAPETLDALVERYFGAFLDEIVKHGGDVNETAGDGLMAVFHEGEHAAAAVEAARAIQRRTRELNAELAGTVEPLRMHIGINTGPASLGATKIEGRAGTRWTYTASGLTTNVAARLAALAEGGQIVLSASTRERLGPGLALDDLGPQALKNVDRAVQAFRLR